MEIKYQGYEHFLLKILVEDGYKDIDIITKRSNVFKTNEGKKRAIFVIYIFLQLKLFMK